MEDHLEHCAECRREAFYFSEIATMVSRVEQVPVRPDFNLRLRAAIQHEEVRAINPRRWYQWDLTPAWRLAVGAAMVTLLFAVSYGSYQVLSPSAPVAPITVMPAPETAVHAATAQTPLDVSQTTDNWNDYTGGDWTEVDLMTPEGLAAQDRYLAARRGPGEYVIETYRIDDPTAKKHEPNYLMTTVPSDQVVRRTSY